MFFRCVIVCILMGFASNVFSLNRELYNAYQKITYSIRGGEMRFACERGLTEFKLSSSGASRPKLFWRSGDNQWLYLGDVTYDDTRITFEGLSKDTGLPIGDLLKQIPAPPLFNQGFAIAERNYFYKSRHNAPVPYIYSIDMINETMQASNAEPVIDYVRFNQRRYLAEQSYHTPMQTITLEQKKQQDQAIQRRQIILNQTIERYGQELKVVTPAYEYESTSQCYLM